MSPTTRCTCWIPTGIVTSWNIGGQRIKGYSPEEIVGQHFSRFYTETDRANGKPARALRIAARTGPLRRGRLARPQGRHLLLGQRRHRSDPRGRQAHRLCQDHPRHHRAPRGPAQVRADAAAAGGIAKARRARPADRRRGARFQQSPDDHQRQSSHPEEGVDDDPRRQRALAAIEAAAKRGAALTSQLLTFARRQSVNPQPSMSPNGSMRCARCSTPASAAR